MGGVDLSVVGGPVGALGWCWGFGGQGDVVGAVHVLSEADGLLLLIGISEAGTHDSQALKPMVEGRQTRHDPVRGCYLKPLRKVGSGGPGLAGLCDVNRRGAGSVGGEWGHGGCRLGDRLGMGWDMSGGCVVWDGLGQVGIGRV
jgi:hypothetical protein